MIFFFSLAVALRAAAPVIFWIDNTSGPASGGEGGNGIYLTIGGNDFGATQGTSTVQINGVAVAQYLTWSNGKIGVQVASSTTTGAITVTTSGGTATGPTFTVRSGNIYYVGPAPDNSNPTSNCTTTKTGGIGTGTYSSPWGFQNSVQSGNESLYSYHAIRTPTTYYDCLSAGDTLVFLDGTHYPYFDGRSLHSALYTGDNLGTSSAPITVMARPGANVSLGGYTTTASGFYAIRMGSSYNVISGMHLNDSCNYSLQTPTCIAIGGNNGGSQRIVNNNAECPWGNAPEGCITGWGPNSVLFGNVVHNTSTQWPSLCSAGGISKQQHVIYGSSNNFEAGWNTVWDSCAYNGIQINGNTNPGSANQSIHDNFFTDVNGCGINWSQVGFTNGTYILTFNNVVYHVGQTQGNGAAEEHGGICFKGFSSDPATGTTLTYNNTFVDTAQYLNLAASQYACAIYDLANNQTNITRQYTNNVFYQAAYANTSSENVYMCSGGSATDAQLQAVMAGSSNNYFYSAGTPGDTAMPPGSTIANPLLTSVSQPIQLWPSSSSPLIGAGASSPAAILDTGAFMPDSLTQTSAPVIGAYLYTSGGPNPMAPLPQTTPASSIVGNTASAGGNVEFTGGASTTAEGTCFSTTPYPTLESHNGGGCTSDGTSSPFTSSLAGLLSNTTYYYRSYATNSVGTSYGGELNFTTAATCAIATTSLPAADTGSSYSQTITTSGCASPTFSVQSGSIPSWSTLGSSSGTMSGTPSGSTPTTSSFSIGVSDANCATSNSGACLQALSILDIAPPTITTISPLTSGTENQPYGPVQFTAAGDNSGTCTGCSWSATGLPTGMTFSGSGSLGGTATVSGIFTMEVTVTNNSGTGVAGPTGFQITLASVATGGSRITGVATATGSATVH